MSEPEENPAPQGEEDRPRPLFSQKRMAAAFGDRIDLILRIILMAAVAIGCYMVLEPFLTAILIAAVIAVVTWPLFSRLHTSFGNASAPAAMLMVTLIIVVFLIPMSLVLVALAQQIPRGVTMAGEWLRDPTPVLEAIEDIPYAGGWLHDELLVAIDPATFGHTVQRFLDPVSSWLVNAAVNVGNGIFQLVLVTFIVFFFYRDGPSLSKKTGMFINRISGGLATEFTAILVNTTRSVVFGVIGTAIGQGLVAAVGFIIAGVPGVVILSFTVCVLSIVPVGPPLVWGPVALWLYATGNVGMAVFMVLWGTLAVSSVDNFIKPILISRGTSMPLALVFLGVFGGIMSFGFLGLVLGPVLLAATLALFKEWTKNPIRIDKAIARVGRLKKDLTETAEDPDEAAKGGHHKALKDESSQPQN